MSRRVFHQTFERARPWVIYTYLTSDRRTRIVAGGDLLVDRAERRAADGGRLAKLPPDLVDRVSGGMSLDEAETVVRDREQRITAWAEKIRTGLDTFTRMAGNPVPAELKEHLSEQELTRVSAVIGVLEPQEGEPNGLVG